jgi:short-subunit dehydrogenase
MAMDLHGGPIRVRLVQPGPIDTDIWDRPGEDPPYYHGPLEPPGLVAEGILAAIQSDQFEHYLPDMKGIVTFKDSDIDGFIAMSASLPEGSTP